MHANIFVYHFLILCYCQNVSQFSVAHKDGMIDNFFMLISLHETNKKDKHFVKFNKIQI